MPQQDIINAIRSLVKEGKSISTATVKARLNGSVDLPTLLALISRYKQSPHTLLATEPEAMASATPDASSTERALTDRVTELEARVVRLEQLLASISIQAQEPRN
ncbi:hypothetical protein GCM10011502_10150 [Oceanisphaera marina]|uniref:KfrA N-terminal DNA-binding domain-containing protein n=1 Tax=Oceanisphaera marina TaxID=2017550 RepID=A0ABQ1IGQ1_9GAMM|nr:hypothetical protein [Oceanisphaera marina]GGB38852.1 hypothetical protein GCM10011502_10150 [Oceanisphaera marina]